jgi:hypothetical protein
VTDVPERAYGSSIAELAVWALAYNTPIYLTIRLTAQSVREFTVAIPN